MSDRLLQALERIQSAQLNARTSSALNPVLWLIATLTTGSAVNGYGDGPIWLTVIFASAAGLSVLVALGLTVYFAIKQPDALRSERYVIQKLAIERGAIGDSVLGIVTKEDKPAAAQLPKTPAAQLPPETPNVELLSDRSGDDA